MDKGKQDFYSRRVAVTGSTGMVGSHLVAELVKAGYSDIVLPVRNRGRIDNIMRTFALLDTAFPGEGITIVETDLGDADGLTEVFRGVDTVFHCAGAIMTGKLDEQGLINNNVAIAKGGVVAARRSGVKKILQTSSIAVLAPAEADGRIITEEDPPHAGSGDTAYAQSKFYADNEMKRAEAAGIGLVTLYPSVIVGEGDWSLNGSSALIRMTAGGFPFYADGMMGYVDVRNVAGAYLALDATPEAVGQGFIVSAENLSYRDLITSCAMASGHRKPFIRVGRGAAMFGLRVIQGLVAVRLMKDRNINKRNIDSIVYGNGYDGSKLEKMCGFEYTPVDVTVDRVMKAYKQEKKLKKKDYSIK